MYKYELNDKFAECESCLLHIKELFEKNNSTIHKARNEIKILDYNGKKYVVKSFKIPAPLKALYYTKTASKAKRSYEYSLKLDKFAPSPVGYIEFYDHNRLQESFFVSEYFDYDWTIREVWQKRDFPNKEEVLKAFARFSFELHEAGVFHLDYSAGNILIKKESDAYTFKIVDLNRMKFRSTLSIDERMKNFDMLWAPSWALKIIAKEYAKVAGMDEKLLQKRILSYALRLKMRKNFKKLLKGKIENIDW